MKIAAIILLVFVTAVESCNHGETTNGDGSICWAYVNISMTWNDALSYCKGLGYTLFSIHDNGENQQQAYLSQAYFPINSTFWLGAYQTNEYGPFKWTDGSNFTYQNWAAGKPMMMNGYVTMQVVGGMWYSDNAMGMHPFMCQGPQGGYNRTTAMPMTTTPCTLPRTSCPDQYLYSGQTNACYYKLLSVLASGGDQNCTAHLTSIHSNTENNLVAMMTSTGLSGAFPNQMTLIGLQMMADGKWHWTDGTDLDYINWAPKEPTNPTQNKCVVRSQDSWDQKWYSIDCGTIIRAAVCKANAM